MGEPNGRCDFRPAAQVMFGGETLTPEQLAKYPRDPEAITSGCASRRRSRSPKTRNRRSDGTDDCSADRRSNVDEYLWNSLRHRATTSRSPPICRSTGPRTRLSSGVTADGTGTRLDGRKGDRFVWNNRREVRTPLHQSNADARSHPRQPCTDPKQALARRSRAACQSDSSFLNTS